MWKYKNGNYTVKILNDGTKIRLGNNCIPEFPESMDIKITNKCNANCKYCHEMSHINGESFNVDQAINLLKDLPNGIEVALGGGNPLECSNDINQMIKECSNIIFNVTVNSKHLKDFNINCNAIGISYNKEDHDNIVKFCLQHTNQVVIHLIAGVHTVEDLERCSKSFNRILILGYKQIGRGKEYYNDTIINNINEFKIGIRKFFNKNTVMVFDNLAIDQLDIKRFFKEDKWNEIYMGDDGEFTMYLDLVKKEFAVSSTSIKRYPINNLNIKEIFNIIRNNKL